MESERSFTRDEVNKIVEERLKRQRSKDSTLAEIKSALLEMKERALIEGESVAELAKSLMEKLSALPFPSPSTVAEVEAADGTPTLQDGVSKEATELEKDELYSAFLEAKEKYEREKRALLAMKHTPVSQSVATVAEAALTPLQRSIARNGGISYREYARLLEQIPKRTL